MLSYPRLELLRVVHTRLLVSVVVGHDRYAVGYLPPGSGLFVPNYRHNPDRGRTAQSVCMSTFVRDRRSAHMFLYQLLYCPDYVRSKLAFARSKVATSRQDASRSRALGA